MIAWEPRREDGPWHLTSGESRKALCGAWPLGSQRDPHKIDDYGGERCKSCWSEWKLRTAASLAAQDQHEAEHAIDKGKGGEDG